VAPHVPPRRFDDERRQKASGRIARMFGRVAPTYDLLNHVLSANVDRRWRRRAVRLLRLTGGERVLDACTGTGDLAIALRDGGAGEVVGCDFAPEMIEHARAKAGTREGIRFEVADVLALPHADDTFDAATVAFGVRNFEDLERGLAELRRVIRPDGRLLVLEFSRPPNPLVRVAYEVYAMVVLPLVGNLVSGGAENAYAYLPRSVQTFPAPDALARTLEDVGFARTQIHPLTLGIATIHLAGG
jgi:demethylmenaquinone methyltransferase/2-methoxy-6-polyprenyl-1,4-benzoquinol methylase